MNSELCGYLEICGISWVILQMCDVMMLHIKGEPQLFENSSLFSEVDMFQLHHTMDEQRSGWLVLNGCKVSDCNTVPCYPSSRTYFFLKYVNEVILKTSR